MVELMSLSCSRRLRFIGISLVLEAELSDFRRWASCEVKIVYIVLKNNENRNELFGLNLSLGLGIRDSSVVKVWDKLRVRFKI